MDEADRLLEQDFETELNEIIKVFFDEYLRDLVSLPSLAFSAINLSLRNSIRVPGSSQGQEYVPVFCHDDQQGSEAAASVRQQSRESGGELKRNFVSCGLLVSSLLRLREGSVYVLRCLQVSSKYQTVDTLLQQACLLVATRSRSPFSYRSIP
jgi:hypothetical protein